MDHRTATRLGATEKYFLGELSEPERAEFEEHYFTCEVCGADVRQAASFLSAARSALVDTDSSQKATLPTPRRVSGWTSDSSLKVAAGIAFASLLGVTGYQRFIEIPRLQRDIQDAQTIRAVPSYFLALSRGEPPIVAISKTDRFVVLTLSQSSDQSYPSYRCTLQDGAGRTLRSEVLPAPTAADELEILLPVTDLVDGRYTLAVQGVADGATSAASGSASISSYAFELRRR